MSVKVFVDTNVLLYSRDASEPEKQQLAMAWMKHLWASQTGRLSFQVIQEFYATVTTKLKPERDPQCGTTETHIFKKLIPARVIKKMTVGKLDVTPFEGVGHAQEALPGEIR